MWILPPPEWQVLQQFMELGLNSRTPKSREISVLLHVQIWRWMFGGQFSLMVLKCWNLESLEMHHPLNPPITPGAYMSHLCWTQQFVQGVTAPQEGGTASNLHHSPCFAPTSFLASCKAAANRVYILIEVWLASLAWLDRTVQSEHIVEVN